MKFRRLMFCLLAASSAAAAARAHPIDEIRTDARFTIARDSIAFQVKLPLTAFAERDAPAQALYAREPDRLKSDLGKRDVADYVASHLLAFDGREALEVAVSTVEFQQDMLSASPMLSAIVSGTFRRRAPIRDLYIIDQLFKESKFTHVGDAVIERGDKRYDFQFKADKFFHLDLTKK